MIARLLGLLAAIVLPVAARAAAPERPAGPNVMVILADDMGIGDVSALNPRSLWRTPHLDRLAAEGMTFTDAHSSSGVCTPTRYTLLTGRYSWRGRLKRGVLNGYGAPLIEPGRLTLPGFLRARGYTTAMFGKWHLGLDWAKAGPGPEEVDYAKPFGGGPVANGFDRFIGISASLDMPPYVWLRDDRVTSPPAGKVGDSPAPRLWRAGPIGADFRMEEVQPRLTRETIDFIAGHAASRDRPPFFVYLALASPHTPTLPTEEFSSTTPTPYGAFVRQLDADVGAILAALEKHGLARDTLVVFTSDNGYAPAGDIPRHRDLGHDSSGGFRGSKSDAFEGGHRVPFIVRWPAVVPRGAVTPALCSQVDLMATIAAATGLNLPPDTAHDSHNLLPVWKSPDSPSPRRTIVHSTNASGYAVRHDRWLLVAAKTGAVSRVPEGYDAANGYTANDQPGELYDLAADLGQRRNLYGTKPGKVSELQALLAQVRAKGQVR